MELPEVFEAILPSIVALGSRVTHTPSGRPPVGPNILGTGFVVDPRGIVLTCGHVARTLMSVTHPKTGSNVAFAMPYASPKEIEPGVVQQIGGSLEIIRYSLLTSFKREDSKFYGEAIPDIAFLQLSVKGIPALEIETSLNTIRCGIPVAFSGFPLGAQGLALDFDGEESQPVFVQSMPFLRQGIVASVHPFP